MIFTFYIGVGEAEGAVTATEAGARLADHLVTAVDRFEAEGFTPKQLDALLEHPEMAATYKGERIDTFFKAEVEQDAVLKSAGYKVTSRFKFGPDVYHPESKVWFDVTTPRGWAGHVVKYEKTFGAGTPLHY
jgi:hypothetical protein